MKRTVIFYNKQADFTMGKIAIPDRILLKPGKFTVEEFEEMKKHAEFGYDMLKGSRFKILQLGADRFNSS